IFAPTDPKLCGPYFVDNALPIAKQPTCSPCLKKRCREPFCLLQIGVQEVYDAALSVYFLEEKGLPPVWRERCRLDFANRFIRELVTSFAANNAANQLK